MKRINIENYTVPAPVIPGTMVKYLIGIGWKPPQGAKDKPITMEYEVKDSLLTLLFGRELNLRAPGLLERDELAQRLKNC